MQKKKLGTIAGAVIALLVGIFGWFATADEPSNTLSSSQTEIGTTQDSAPSNTEQENGVASTLRINETQTTQETTGTTRVETTSLSRTTSQESSANAVIQKSDLPTIVLDSLPPEALDTLELIENKGPYPYRQDNGTFQNRERILPIEHSKYYREFTVETPGSRDRGARRIVTGGDGEGYYTSDHYTSFKEIEGWSWK